MTEETARVGWTSGEWEFDRAGSIIYGPDGEVIAQFWTRPNPADAARIVQCVNNFDELVAALKPLARLADLFEGGSDDDPIHEWHHHVFGSCRLSVGDLRTARLALAKAAGGTP